jgi:hypothetical protein
VVKKRRFASRGRERMVQWLEVIGHTLQIRVCEPCSEAARAQADLVMEGSH